MAKQLSYKEKMERAEAMEACYRKLNSLAAVGMEWGLSKERVRQIIKWRKLRMQRQTAQRADRPTP